MGFLLGLEYHDSVTYYMANYFEFDINFEIISFRFFEFVFIAMIFKLKIYIQEYFYFYFELIVFIALMHTCLFKFPVRFILRYVFDKLNWKGETLNMDLFFSHCLISTNKFCSTQYKRLARFKPLLCMAKHHKNILYQCSKIRLNSINKIRQLFAT